MAKTIVGLEVTEEGVRAAEVTIGRAPSVVAFGAVPLPPGAAKDSEVFDREAVVLALRQLWQRSGIRSKRVILGIGSRRILVREFTTQALRPDLLRQALPFQVHDLLPVPVEQAVLDFAPVAQHGDQVTGLLVAAVAETVEDLVSTVGRAKVTVDVVDLAPFALARAAGVIADAGETVAAIHLGDHTSYVVVVRDGVPRFVRIIPVDIPTQASRTRELAMLSEAAEGAVELEEVLETVPPSSQPPMRRSRGGVRTARPTELSEAAVADLAARLRSTLAFYSERAGDRPLARVLLSGAGSVTPGLAAALAASLPIPVEYVGAARLAGGKTIPPGDDDLNLVTTVGLALRGGR
ncbi:type IV pilus biogenesis protein PilM [Microbacterium timonense]|jgi:type IV pilus assembly protein PilM|uniref:type IV pilus biogenesis protein PilM n=1 Tax=Microbacterium timonense TaxID=2086576 RepID=UPI00135674E1|nr:pilus assembly protein PilM [Microbacterium timonense]